MENWKYLFIGLGIGIVLALVVYIVMAVKRSKVKKLLQADVEKYKRMLSDRMELEDEGIKSLKKENEELKSLNKNLEISLSVMAQKPGKKEIQRLEAYQRAVDRLSLSSPGFAAAWQGALKDSEEEMNKTFKGWLPFRRKAITTKTDIREVSYTEEDE